MGTRLGLHKELCDIFASFDFWKWDDLNFQNGSIPQTIDEEAKKHVYYRPPESFKILYPCIIYDRSSINTIFANDMPYINTNEYTITVIDKNPDSLLIDKVLGLKSCVFINHFIANNLNHDIFRIYY